MKTIRPDGDLHNADWTKRTWDLPRTRDEFVRFLRHSGMTLESLMQLPAAEAMPEELRLGLT